MATILHLIKSADAALARTVIEQHVGAGDRVTVALLPGGMAPALPPGVAVHHVGSELSYPQLPDRLVEADRVVTSQARGAEPDVGVSGDRRERRRFCGQPAPRRT